MSDLPRGWCWAKLGELCDDAPHSMTDGPFGSNLKSEHYCASGVRVVRLGNIGVGRFVRDDEAFIAPSRLTELSKHRCFAGDLLIAALAEPVGRCAPVPDDLGPAIVKADCIRFKPRAEIDAAYLMHELNSPGGLARTAEASHGVGRLRINLGELREVLVPVAPLTEQQRIVAKLDELLARSRAAREALAAIPPLLDRYRQSVLAAAFRGELTAGWRATTHVHSPSVTPDWPVFSMNELAADVPGATAIGPFGSNLKVSDYESSGVRLVFVRNIRSRQFNALNDQYVSPTKAAELAPHRVKSGDLLVTKMGDPPGDTAVYPRAMPDAIITADCIKMTVGIRTSAEFLSHWLLTPPVRARLLEEVRGVAQQKLSLDRFRSLKIELPSLAEQQEIVRRVDAAFARIDAVRALVEAQRVKLDAIDRAILARAFRGELVPQDPNDEPASEMLARIRAAREAAPGKAPRRGRAHAQG